MVAKKSKVCGTISEFISRIGVKNDGSSTMVKDDVKTRNNTFLSTQCYLSHWDRILSEVTFDFFRTCDFIFLGKYFFYLQFVKSHLDEYFNVISKKDAN